MRGDIRWGRLLGVLLCAGILLGSVVDAEAWAQDAPPTGPTTVEGADVRPPEGATSGADVRPPEGAVLRTEIGSPDGVPSSLPRGKDTEFWRDVRMGVPGTVALPDPLYGVLVQSEGELWRNVRNGPLSTYGAWVLLAMVLILAAFFAIRGRVRIEGGRSGRTILRFNAFERFVHWLTATSFIVLALTGLNLLYGRYVLKPLIGPDGFATLAQYGKIVHDAIGFVFILGIAVMLVIWVKDNIPNKIDWQWLRKGGGLIGRAHPHAQRFNAGQKMIFWLVVLVGAVISFTGVTLIFPFYYADMQQMQIAHVVHTTAALLLIAVIIAHIYLGTIGMEGAWDAMGSGRVDEQWAREHHDLWVAKLKGESVEEVRRRAEAKKVAAETPAAGQTA